MSTKVIKLVRDNMPEICKKNNFKSKFYVADEQEYLQRLKDKLQEEVNEYLKDNNIEELADILEVVYALVEATGYSQEDLEIMRKAKSDKRGKFLKRLVIEFDK